MLSWRRLGRECINFLQELSVLLVLRKGKFYLFNLYRLNRITAMLFIKK
jgi:hypothetical protein